MEWVHLVVNVFRFVLISETVNINEHTFNQELSGTHHTLGEHKGMLRPSLRTTALVWGTQVTSLNTTDKRDRRPARPEECRPVFLDSACASVHTGMLTQMDTQQPLARSLAFFRFSYPQSTTIS